jgi:hypothetical protein
MKFNGQLPYTLIQSDQLKAITGYDENEIDVIVQADAWCSPQTYWEPEDSGVDMECVFTIASDGAIIDIIENLTEQEIELLAEKFYVDATDKVNSRYYEGDHE